MDSSDSGSVVQLSPEPLPTRTLRQIGRHLQGDDSTCEFILALWGAGRGLRLDLQRVMRPLGLSDVKFGTLLSLYALAPTPSNPVDLAYHAGVTRSSMTDVLDQLEGCGWIQRQRFLEDRRVVHVTLSGDGRAQVEKAIGVFFHEVEALTAGITAEQRSIVSAVCSALNRVLLSRAPHQAAS
ncbi:hypothetical protein DB347_17435 [Opitutaceae bacterium EW11]|nr:hypothetical protein DB347_17435 [Opitutaceae bacterium EW11]